MKAKQTRASVVIGLVICASQAALAQSGAVTLSLDEAIARGRASAPRVAEARARREAADAAVTSREALRMPSVTASAGYQRTNHVDEFGIPQAGGSTRIIFPDIPNNLRGRADASVPIYTGGRIDALIQSASLDRNAAEADTRTAEADVSLEVARAYWALVTARESARVVERGLARLDGYVSDVKSRVDAGFLPPNEVLTAQSQRARQSVAVIQAKNAALVAQAELCRLVGLDFDTAIVTSTPLFAPDSSIASLTAMPVSVITAIARSQRSELDALTERAEAARATGAAAAASMKPQIGVAVGVEESRPNARFVPRVNEWRTSWEAGISVTWQLFDGGKSRADRAAAAAQAVALERRRDDFDAILGVELRQRRLEVEAGRSALEASAEAVSASTEARRVIEERFKAGVATSFDVLDAQTSLLEAELERTRLAAALRLNEARLLRAVGRPKEVSVSSGR